MRSYDLIGCGALNLDLIYRLPDDSPLWRELPPPGAEQALTPELRARVDQALAGIEPARSGGGQAANTSFALARLGFSAAMLGRIGADDAGRFLVSELAPCDARYLALDGESGRVYVLLNEAGERRNLVWPAANDDFSAPTCRGVCRRRASPTSRRSWASVRWPRSSPCSNACPPASRSPSTPARSTPASA